jgi:hypothetical protein
MIIESGNITSNADGTVNALSYGGYDIHYKGLIFIPGFKAGDESVKHFIDVLNFTEKLPFEQLMGNYFLFLSDTKSQSKFLFTDNSGIFKVYKYSQSVSTSFLELIENYSCITIDDLDFNSVNEFLHLGFTYFENTFINKIKKLDGASYYKFENDKIIEIDKGLDPINSLPKYNIDEYFKHLTYAIQDETVSLDITGGFDSRLVISFFEKLNLNYNDLSVSGQKNNKDIVIARQIAETIHKKIYVDLHKTEKLSFNDVDNIFQLTDAQLDVIAYHRNNKMNKCRQARGITLQMGGGGGELYKDYWWLQDFPFYKRKKTNLQKLYDLRIESIRFKHSLLGENILPLSINFRDKTIENLSKYIMTYNTQSYDNIYLNYKMKTNAGVYTTIANNYYLSYCPLLEYEIVKIGFNLKRKERFSNNWHKSLITRNCPKISVIKTTEDISASSYFSNKLKDSINYLYNKVKRLSKQLLRKLLNKTYFQESPVNDEVAYLWRETKDFEELVNTLKRQNILNQNLIANQIPINMIGKISTIGLLVKKLLK